MGQHVKLIDLLKSQLEQPKKKSVSLIKNFFQFWQSCFLVFYLFFFSLNRRLRIPLEVIKVTVNPRIFLVLTLSKFFWKFPRKKISLPNSWKIKFPKMKYFHKFNCGLFMKEAPEHAIRQKEVQSCRKCSKQPLCSFSHFFSCL